MRLVGGGMSTSIHLASAIWVLVAGILQLSMKKGTRIHRVIGWSWMLSMLTVSISSFWLTGLEDWFHGYGPFHILSVWVIICVIVSTISLRAKNLHLHKSYAIGAFLGLLGQALARS